MKDRDGLQFETAAGMEKKVAGMSIMKRVDTEKLICFVIAFCAAALAFGVFFAQSFFSDVVTFAKAGDAGRQTLPSFIHLGYQMGNGIWEGVDVLITNGSNSLYKSGLEWYFVYRIFALLGYFTRPVGCFILFYAFHMFISLYYTQRLCMLYFGMKRPIAVVAAVSSSFTALTTYWFASFFIIYSLALPLTYFIIRMLNDDRKMICVLSSLVYVTAFNSGYSTVSCTLAAAVFCFAFLWGLLYTELGIKKLAVKMFVPAVIGAAVCFPFLLKIFLSVEKTSQTSIMSLFGAIDFPIKVENLPSFIFFSYKNTSVEGNFLTAGLFWFFICILFVLSKVTKRMDKKVKIIFWCIVSLNLLCVLISLENVLPFGIWFYEVPAFGWMHVRQRYLLVVMPYLYLALGLGLMHLDKQTDKRYLYISLGIFVAAAAGIIFVGKDHFEWNQLVCELIITGIGLYMAFNEWIVSKQFLYFMTAGTICFTCNRFYAEAEVSVSSDRMKARSAAYDMEAQKKLDQYVFSLGQKEIYKYAGIESVEKVPMYIMNNFGWYHSQQALLSNYLKYPIHGSALAGGYSKYIQAGWFDRFDWNYLFDTRADFAVIDQGVVDADSALYNNDVIDWDHDCVYLYGEHVCVTVKKYIPRHYTNTDARVLDRNPSLDNGYFYCPTLMNDDIVDFSTDHASEFSITVNADSHAELQFCLFPVDHYSYYLDGEEYEPVKDYGLAYFSIPEGKHEIRILYRNDYEKFIRILYYGYYAACFIAALIMAVKSGVRTK